MSDETAITVNNVSKIFKLPHEKNNTIKGAIVNFYRRNKSFENQQALKDVSFEIKKGEFFGIVGRNGSGKSTLLKMLAGIYSPTEGSIETTGKLIPFIELGVGFSPELTGRENIFLNGALLGFSRKEMHKMYDEIVEFSEIERFMDQKLKNYSSGMQVRLAFSIAIRAKGDILLLDEVLAVGDASFQQKCYDYFEELKREKKTVVFVSHDMGAVRRFCNKAVFINNGKLISQGTPSDIADIYTEDNLEATQNAKSRNGQTPSANHKVSLRIASQKDNKVELRISYGADDKEEMYVGISVIKDGISVAEINTLPDITFKGNGELGYTLDTTPLNGGVYNVTAALFHTRNKELLTFTSNRSKFIIKGDDYTRGAALKLENTWRSVEDR